MNSREPVGFAVAEQKEKRGINILERTRDFIPKI